MKKTENRIINVISIFTIGFLLPFIISFLKLSKLSSDYDIRTIILVIGSYLSFYFGAKYVGAHSTTVRLWRVRPNNVGAASRRSRKQNASPTNKKKEAKCFPYNITCIKIIIFIGIISFVSFLIEFMILKFIPLLSLGTPHAYSTFHVFGLHYITTLFFMMPAMAVLNYYVERGSQHHGAPLASSPVRGKRGSHSSPLASSLVLIFVSFAYAILMSLLLVSRALLIMTVVLAGIAYLVMIGKPTKAVGAHRVRPYGRGLTVGTIHWIVPHPYIIFVAVFVVFVLLYIVITYFRSHSVEYLNGIFEMKENTPIFITQPYMYLTQGFENLNYLVINNERLTFGRRTLNPLFSLLRTKVYFPLVTEAPFYQIKLELTSKPIIYDLYYDFSFLGTCIIMFFIGFITKRIENKAYKENNIYYILFFSLICYYLLFSFFQSYLSMLDVWFYLIFIYLLYLVSTFKKTKR